MPKRNKKNNISLVIQKDNKDIIDYNSPLSYSNILKKNNSKISNNNESTSINTEQSINTEHSINTEQIDSNTELNDNIPNQQNNSNILYIQNEDNRTSIYIKTNKVSITSFDELMKVYKNTVYHTSKKKDLEFLTNLRKIVNFYISYAQFGIPCFQCAKSNEDDINFKNKLVKLNVHTPITERKILINEIVLSMIKNCIDFSSHNLEIHNVPLFVSNQQGGFNPVNVNVIHDFFKQAGDINMLMQADDNTYFIWYKDDDVALAVYNYMSSRGCYSDNVKLELKLRLKKTALVNWSKPLKI
jgi:hypothetical protein